MSSQQAARVSSQSAGTWDRSSASSMPKSEGKGFGAATAQYSRSWTQWFPTRHSRTGSCSRELVHVVQYEKLGLKEFAAKYVTGFLSGGSYEAIPLEMNADEVQRWIDTGRF